MDTEALVKHAINADAEKFQQQFGDIMNDKVTAEIEKKYAHMFGAPVEDSEEIEAETPVEAEAETGEKTDIEVEAEADAPEHEEQEEEPQGE